MTQSAGGSSPLISIVMGSQSDFDTMSCASEILDDFGIEHEVKIISAHRTPDRLYDFAKNAQSRDVRVIIAGAGGAAHLPGMVASMTLLPVLGVPIQSKSLNGIDSLLSISQMPGGIPVGALAIGKAGAKNAALLAVSILALNNKEISEKLKDWRDKQTNAIPDVPEKI